MEVGKTKWFNRQRGFGFIESPKVGDVFYHVKENKVAENFNPDGGDTVGFEVVPDPKKPGKFKAINVKIVVPTPAPVEPAPIAASAAVTPQKQALPLVIEFLYGQPKQDSRSYELEIWIKVKRGDKAIVGALVELWYLDMDGKLKQIVTPAPVVKTINEGAMFTSIFKAKGKKGG